MKTKMKMVNKDGKMVPAFAADGKGKMKTGGMVNSNTKTTVVKKATSKVGGISKAPKTAMPKAMYGASMKPSMMKKGGVVKKTMTVKRMK